MACGQAGLRKSRIVKNQSRKVTLNAGKGLSGGVGSEILRYAQHAMADGLLRTPGGQVVSGR